MLLATSNSNTYTNDFTNRFKNFCDKAPILLSFTTSPKGVQVVDERKNKIWDFDWDFSIPVKSFIFGIKQILISKECYPIIHKVETFIENISVEEQIALAVANNIDISQIPTTREIQKKTPYLIDKCIIYKDIAIVKDMDTEELFRYQLGSSIVYFLNKLSSGKFTKETAGIFFFKNATLLNKIVPKDASVEER